MPKVSSLRGAGAQAEQPCLPRTNTGMSWPTSIGASSDGDEEDPDIALKAKPPQMKRGWSNVSCTMSAIKEKMVGPRLQIFSKPPMLRSMTTFSWHTNASETGASGSEPTTPQYPSSHASRPKLQRGASNISFHSFKSWHSQSTSISRNSKNSKRSKSRERDFEKELIACGERNISFIEQRVIVQPQVLNEKNLNQPNKIRTARFTLLTWLPKSLFYQFRRIANIYFLLICVLVNFKFSPKDWKSKVFPFMGVILWTALKDLWEDRQRRRDDAIENKQTCQLFDADTKMFKNIRWEEVFCGDVLVINSDEVFPADMILLHIGGCAEAFISTISLDGETNLKERRPPAICDTIIYSLLERRQRSKQSMLDVKKAETEAIRVLDSLNKHALQVRLSKPEVAVTDVKGTLSSNLVEDGQHKECPLDWVNFLPRGCKLKNTAWVLGVVAYIGGETKARLNSAKSKGKVSNMQVYLNYCVWGLLMGLLIVCVYSATMSSLGARLKWPPEVSFEADEFKFCCDDTSWIIRFGVFLITFYHVVPMSLYVVFEMLKLLLGYLVNSDKQMICPETGESAMARTADLIEEMGQISFLFSDKTGTLTKNEMVFARCSINGLDPGDFRRSKNAPPGEITEGVDNVCEILEGDSGRPADEVEKVERFFTCLALCHTVQVQGAEEIDNGDEAPIEDEVPTTVLAETLSPKSTHSKQKAARKKIASQMGREDPNQENGCHYLGMSPDEVALVQAAKDVGIVFTSRCRNYVPGAGASSSMVVVTVGDEERAFNILYVLEFNSDRKRMSVVCLHQGEYYCITKGADSVMEDLAIEKYSAKYVECLKRFSQEGLRTLVVAMKKVENQEYLNWERRYVAALACLDDTKDAKIAAVAAEMEQQMDIVGISAVEDRLQDGVPEAIATIKSAGIRLWVLTGDKTETAVDIAKSCLLFTSDTHLAYATEADSVASASEKLRDAKAMLDGLSWDKDKGLVLDGRTIQYAFTDESCQDLIYELGIASRACVCCRLTPLQKRQLVELVHKKSPSTITLAIGDGANDVPMIEGAHLGVAVRGKEGCQAVQVSDVAISQFRFLVPLLLCHGRRAYRKIALFLCFYLYKNVALAMGDVVWMHQDQYQGRIAFPEYLSVNYNFLFTSWHILFVLGFDSDVDDSVAVNTPNLYLSGPARELFNGGVFTNWMIVAVYHGIVAWLVPNLWFGGDVYDKKKPGPFWVGSCASFTIIIFIACLKLLLSSVSPCKIKTSILPTLAAIVMYVMVLGMLSYTPMGIALQPNMEGVPAMVLESKDAMISMFALPPACMTVDVLSKVLRVWCFPTPLDSVKKPWWTLW